MLFRSQYSVNEVEEGGKWKKVWSGFPFKEECRFAAYIFDYKADPSTRLKKNEITIVQFYENNEEDDYRCRIIGRKRKDQKVLCNFKSLDIK